MRDLPPNIFAVVMATGIVALAVNAAGWPAGGHVLFWGGVAAYAVLWVLTAARCARHWPVVRADLTSHARGPGFFTVVAATGVLGDRGVTLHDPPGWGLALWAVALVLWAGLSYTILPGLIESEHKPELEKGLSGVWLLTVVATQAVCVLGCLVIPHLPGPATGPGLFAVLCFGRVAGLLFRRRLALISPRSTPPPPAPAALPPPYWINMGAVAISTLGGVSLVAAAPGSGLLVDLLPF